MMALVATHTSATHMASEGMSSAQRWGWSATDQPQPHAGEVRHDLHRPLQPR
jgi:hypothetical protein